MPAQSLYSNFIHLGLGARAEAQPQFTGMDWYADYAARTGKDGVEGRLVSIYRFAENWNSWEMHPLGDEVVVCLSGTMTLHQEQIDGSASTVVLGPGDFAINAPGIWHTADVTGDVTALFITAGMNTQQRPR